MSYFMFFKYYGQMGLILDEKMNWSEHVSYIKSKIKPFLAMLRRSSYLIPSSTRLSVYYSYIHCHLLYLAPIWGYTGNTRLEEVARFQNKAIRLVFWQGYQSGTNTEGLFKKFKILRHPAAYKIRRIDHHIA
jgi:hypothetical protein